MDTWSSFIQGAFSDLSVPQRWADLGCGKGTFTYALGDLLPSGSMLYAVDTEPQILRERVGGVRVAFHRADFEHDPLPSGDLDGVLLANAIHYVRDKESLIRRLSHYCKPSHAFLIVEYDRLTANPWVPYPIDFTKLTNLFERVGYHDIMRLGERRSRYGGTMYAALIKKTSD